MAQTLNLIRRSCNCNCRCRPGNGIFLLASRSESTQTQTVLVAAAESSSSSESLAVQKIEDAIHRIIVRRSAPDWIPFLPGASYWAPPRRTSYGIADLVHKLANSLSDEQVMSLASFRGWPSSAFYLDNESDTISRTVSQSEDEQV